MSSFQTLQEAEADRDWWQSMAPPGWKVSGWTYRSGAHFVRIVGDSITDHADFDGAQVDFLLAVAGKSRDEQNPEPPEDVL